MCVSLFVCLAGFFFFFPEFCFVLFSFSFSNQRKMTGDIEGNTRVFKTGHKFNDLTA